MSSSSNVAQAIYERSLRNAIRIRGLEDELLGQVLALLGRSHTHLLRKIEARLERLGPVEAQEAGRGRDTTRRLQKIADEIRATIEEYYRAAGVELRQGLMRVAERTVASEAALFEATLPFAYSSTRPSRDLLRSIVTSRPFEGRLLKDWVGKIGADEVARVSAEIDLGLASGETVPDIVRRIRGEATGRRHQFTWKGKQRWYVEYRGGVLQTSTRHATSLVRTAVMHVYAGTRESLWEANDDLLTDEILWISVLDENTSKICQLRDHKRYNRKTHEPVGHDLPYLGGPGKAHYGGCRAVPIPFVKPPSELGAAGFDLSGITPGERQAIGRSLPATQDYSAFLRGEDEETQALALRSKRRAAWFRSHPGATVEDAWAVDFSQRSQRAAA